MRENKFRGKRVDNGEWIYGDLAHNYDSYIKDNKNLVDDLHRGWFKVIDNTVGQYIGVKDVDGNEIYGGHIVKGTAIKENGGFDYLGKVVFYNQSNLHGYFIEDADGRAWRLEHACCKVSLDNITGRIVGNIHDNPELLKGCE